MTCPTEDACLLISDADVPYMPTNVGFDGIPKSAFVEMARGELKRMGIRGARVIEYERYSYNRDKDFLSLTCCVDGMTFTLKFPNALKGLVEERQRRGVL